MEHKKTWMYILDEMTIEIESIESISVASNDIFGNQSIKKLNF